MGNTNIYRLWMAALKAADRLPLVSGDVLYILPQVDNVGTLAIGDSDYAMDFQWNGATAANTVLYDCSLDTVIFDGIDLHLEDVDLLRFGDSQDVTVQWDATKFTVVPAADDSVMEIGDGSTSFDVKTFGNIPTAYTLFDASASTLGIYGPVRPVGLNAPSPRYELRRVFGERGLPRINATTQLPGGDAYDTSDFLDTMNSDRDFELLGTNASNDDVAFYAEGGLKVETDGGANDQVIILPHLTNITPWTSVTWGTDKSTVWECHIKTGSAVTATLIWAGLKLTNTPVVATDADQVFFRYEVGVNGGEWQCISSIGGTDTSTDSNVVCGANTEFHLKIEITSSRTARFFINGALIYTTAALTDAVDLIPYIGIEGQGAAKHMYVFSQAISRVIG